MRATTQGFDRSGRRLLLLLVAAALAAACRAQAPPPAQEDVTIWQRRGSWTGRGVTQTDPFISETGLLRITWEARGAAGAAPGAGSFRIVLHSDVSGRELQVPVERAGPGNDVTYVVEDPRSFFLVIDSKDLDYTVEVAEGIPGKRAK